jgi:hypothetical protein
MEVESEADRSFWLTGKDENGQWNETVLIDDLKRI